MKHVTDILLMALGSLSMMFFLHLVSSGGSVIENMPVSVILSLACGYALRFVVNKYVLQNKQTKHNNKLN